MQNDHQEGIPFTRMHGAGNHFLIIESDYIPHPLDSLEHQRWIQKICHPVSGIFSDGVLGVYVDEEFPRMIMWNPDGSRSVCGNGLRCFVHYMYESRGLQCEKVHTDSGIVDVNFRKHAEYTQIAYPKVSLGKAVWDPQLIPLGLDYANQADSPEIHLNIENKNYVFYAVSMGNPHLVSFQESISESETRKIGSLVENMHHLLPEKGNIEFVRLIDEHSCEAMVWERGAGFTLACGTGSAAIFATYQKYKNPSSRSLEIQMPGGKLVTSGGQGQNIFLEGETAWTAKGKLFL